MSTQQRNDETVDNTSIEQETCLCKPIENEHLSLKSSSTECKDSICEDCVPVKKDDQFNGKCFMLIGDHESQISEGGEADLHQHKNNCTKNPGHLDFIPIESFRLKHIPEDHQVIDLYEYIKAVADLTVKLSVTMTSPDRPEFWPNTKNPYFLSAMRGKTTLRTGTGMVWKVLKFTDEDEHWKHGSTTCLCDKCKASDEPSKVWWEIYVRTAAHVVVDDIEANHTTMRLFYDREDSEVVILKDKVYVDEVFIERDRCWLTCLTCDKHLANKLQEMEKHFADVRKKVYLRYTQGFRTDDFNFIVSHPHGCNKQVSVGQMKGYLPVGDDKNDNQLTYTTCTCPGSSGAFVHFMGSYGWCFERVHSGSLESGLNVSSVY